MCIVTIASTSTGLFQLFEHRRKGRRAHTRRDLAAVRRHRCRRGRGRREHRAVDGAAAQRGAPLAGE